MQDFDPADVGLGSRGDIAAFSGHVCFTPESGHPARRPAGKSQHEGVAPIGVDTSESRRSDFALPATILAEIVLARQITFLTLQPDARLTEEELCA